MTEMEERVVSGWRKRRPVKPKWGGRHGSRVKGSVTWSPEEGAWQILFSFLLGYESTTRATERYINWRVAMVEYIEHDRAVRERKKLEDFRSVRAVL